jgi:hypothetical protein
MLNDAVEIPEALHICPGCSDLACGAELCWSCANTYSYLEAQAQVRCEQAKLRRQRAVMCWCILLGTAGCWFGLVKLLVWIGHR